MLECWGKSKHEHRRVNDCVGKHLHRNIKSPLTTEGDNAVLPLKRVRRFARKARGYRMVYEKAGLGNLNSHAVIEKMYKIRKCHRSAFDLDLKFILSA